MNPIFIIPLLILLFSASAVYPQLLPYITDVVGVEDEEMTPIGRNSSAESRFIGTFKLFNPDTVPFYIWITFENGAKFTYSKRTKSGKRPSVRLVDLELHYKNDKEQPIVKRFPNNNRYTSRTNKRFGGSWLGGGRSEKRRHRGRGVENEFDVETEAEVEVNRKYRGNGASEIPFWKEDAQRYYEMELWGVLYAPDVEKAVAPGNYVENIKFEIEAMR